jgi:integrase
VQGGIPLTEITSLRVVTTLPFIETALNWHFERKGERLTADMGVFAATIASISQYLGITGPAWDVIKGRLDEVKPPARTGMTERNTLLNEQLKDAQTRAALLHLPAMLMGEAARLKDGWQDLRGPHHPPRPQEAGWLSQVAVAIEILLNAPVRMANLHTMRLGQELRLTQVTRSRWRGLILVDETQSKNNRGVEFPLAPETVALLRRHLDEFRPLLPNVETDWLFSGAATPDRPRHPSSLGDAITNTIYQYVGLRMNPHAFRAFAGARILARNPHAIDDVRAVLGHSGFQTAMIYYTAVNGRAAAERLSADLARERRDTAHLVPPLPTRRGRPQRGKPERGK